MEGLKLRSRVMKPLPRKFVRQYPVGLLASAHGRAGYSDLRSYFLQPRFKMGRFHFCKQPGLVFQAWLIHGKPRKEPKQND